MSEDQPKQVKEQPKRLSREETIDLILNKLEKETFNNEEILKVKTTLKKIVKASKKPSKLSKVLKPRFIKIYNRCVPTLEYLSQKQYELRNKMRDANLKRLEQKNLKLKKKIEQMKERCNL